MRDPGARAGAHDRLQRRHQPAGRPLHLDAPVLAHVDVGFAIGDDQDLVALQVLAQDAAQVFRRPADLRLVAHPALALQFAHHRLQIARDRAQLARFRLGRKGERLAADQRLDAGHPAAKRQLRDHHRDERDHRADGGEQVHDVLLGIGAAPLDEAHVVHDQQLAQAAALGHHRGGADVQRTALLLQHAARFLGRVARGAAGDFRRQRRRAVDQLASAVAEAEGEQALVLQDASEQRLHALQAHAVARVVGEQFDQGFLHRAGDQILADVEVAYEPLQR